MERWLMRSKEVLCKHYGSWLYMSSRVINSDVHAEYFGLPISQPNPSQARVEVSYGSARALSYSDIELPRR